MKALPPNDGLSARSTAADVFRAFLRLGFTSFGGPVAHIGYFRTEFVERRKWLTEANYADMVALCQFLPGPASSQVGVSLGMLRAGLPGALAAWCGFTLPSAIALILFAYGLAWFGDLGHSAWLGGLKAVAVAVVAQAVWAMAQKLCPDRQRKTLALVAAILVLAIPSSLGQVAVIVLGGIYGRLFIRGAASSQDASIGVRLGRTFAIASLGLFAVLLVALPWVASQSGSHAVDLAARFYRSGSLVFGGGHVVLPLLQDSVVPPGWIGNDAFLAGYGAAQAVPGPLFTFSAYLGAAMGPQPHGWLGGLLCLVAIYLPSFLLLIGVLPFWDALRKMAAVQAALAGVNAAVVGLLLAALYKPVWTSGVRTGADFAMAAVAFLLLTVWKIPPWLVVILGGITAEVVARIT
jgi:chromate transporter